MNWSVRRIGLLCIAVAFVVDQATKALALAFAPLLAARVEVLPVFNLVLVHNRGVSFGMFGGVVPWWGLTIIGLAIVGLLAYWLWQAHDRVSAAGCGLVIGGALGNLLDRVRHKAVTDFLDFHIAGYHWPAFNMADVAVVGGVGLMLLDSLRKTEHQDSLST